MADIEHTPEVNQKRKDVRDNFQADRTSSPTLSMALLLPERSTWRGL